MGKDYTVEHFQQILDNCEEVCYKNAPNIDSALRQAFVDACKKYSEGYEVTQKAKTDADKEAGAKMLEKAMKKCVKAGGKILPELDLTESPEFEAAVLKGHLISHNTPERLVEFCKENKKHRKLVDHLLKETTLMKEMILNGGAKGGNYGPAMKIYAEVLATFPDYEDEFSQTNKKLAMAVALELAEPMYEFDTKVLVSPINRFKHYSEAFRNGELDPAFPHFSIWELRHVVNCDAKDDQLQWGRDMLMNYAPYITAVTDAAKRYLYILDTDVLMRNPHWTDSPRTYQQVISGGGKESPNAWFGRYICKTFGIPTWGCKQDNKHYLTRWTADGWVAVNGATWEKCEWEGVSGVEFQGEVNARATYTPEEYFDKLVLLECMANTLDAKRGALSAEEKNVLHPLRTWRSLSIVQKSLMVETPPAEKFARSGDSPVTTNSEKYLEIYEKDEPDDEIKVKSDKITIAMGAKVSTFGNSLCVAGFKGGKQLNFVGPGSVDFDLPEDVESKTYKLTMEVNTVHLKQGNTFVSVNHGEKIPVTVPYTVGKWQKTKEVEVTLSANDTVTILREKGTLGIAIRKMYLK